MDAPLAYNVVVDECFKFSITMLLNSTIMLVIVLHYASICSYASILLLCSKLCQHNSPRPNPRVMYSLHHKLGLACRTVTRQIFVNALLYIGRQLHVGNLCYKQLHTCNLRYRQNSKSFRIERDTL